MSHKDMTDFSIAVSGEQLKNPETMEFFQELMDKSFYTMNDYAVQLAKELKISEACAVDVAYLRTRSRWTEELEKELIRLHKAGTPPNVFEFGHNFP